jgi:hypothetical protein
MRTTFTVLLAALMLAGCLSKVEPISNVDNSTTVVDDPTTGDPIVQGSVTLTWQPPTQNSDGTPLLDLAGYTIYVGTESNTYDFREVRLDNPGLTSYVVDQLDPDTYYFAATAFNSSGVESSFSGEIVKTVN